MALRASTHINSDTNAPRERRGVALDSRQAAQAPDQAPALAQRGHRQERLRAVLKASGRLRAPALPGFQLSTTACLTIGYRVLE